MLDSCPINCDIGREGVRNCMKRKAVTSIEQGKRTTSSAIDSSYATVLHHAVWLPPGIYTQAYHFTDGRLPM